MRAAERRIVAEYRKRLARMGVELILNSEAGDAELLPGELAAYRRTMGHVVVNDALPAYNLRPTLEHECVHVELGHGFVTEKHEDPEYEFADEICDHVAARRLLPIEELAGTFVAGLRQSKEPLGVVMRDALVVDRASIGWRLTNLTMAETGYLSHYIAGNLR